MPGNLIGKVLLDQYRVDAFIASGGMGTVYRVWDIKRNVPLAMKTLHAELTDDPHIFKRFEREARALKKLAHPNIVPFYGLYHSEDFAFLLEKFVDGPSLAGILKQNRGQPLPFDEAMRYLKALCAALGYAHANGVIHCDVKPGNVMVERSGNIYLTDFGIARHAESTSTTMGAAGTPSYMAPEQIRGEAVTPATDIYALGVILFEMLTGQRPFRGAETGTEQSGQTAAERIRHGHLHLSPPDPRQLNPSISAGVAAVILKCLEKKPEERYATAQEMFLAVCAAAGMSDGEIANRAEAGGGAVVARGSSQAKLVVPPESKRGVSQTQKLLLLGFGVFVVLVACLGLWGASKLLLPQVAQPKPDLTVVGQVAPTVSIAVDTPIPAVTEMPAPTATDTPLPSAAPAQLVNAKDGAAIILIPSGEFTMGIDQANDPNFWGGEGPAHKISLNDFYIYRTEVTNGMYALCAKEKQCPKPSNNTSQTRKSYFGNPQFNDYPVVLVSWVMANAYCKWAGGRLPTEAEWEKAARGTDGRRFPWGNALPKPGLANFSSPDTVKVGKYPNGASPYGVLDMAGNVLEWVHDIYAPEYYKTSPEENPSGPDTGSKRVIRGGSWHSGFDGLRTVARASLKFDDSNNSVGFRCAQDTP